MCMKCTLVFVALLLAGCGQVLATRPDLVETHGGPTVFRRIDSTLGVVCYVTDTEYQRGGGAISCLPLPKAER